ncbi:alkyl/aryl-sulfatase [Fibrobacter sp. UWB12]|uniref:alkyl/aryl-sulfatase n=1 Tax=Fibrobacter sp. UWB12 TaxID=1896203 RepID=UPI0009123A3F|nr:alkyl sulfatase dimerization domain-containing protein [Fibrobacter sp. UWB12]SHK69105.1 Alkyl sulfatase BDS1, metallo-beta-lactamase superfamily [Fibrobacter sp. UWB12]
MTDNTPSVDPQASVNKKFESSAFTRIKNHYEALRSGLGDGNKRSSEYNTAKCKCCSEKFPDITGVWSQKNYTFLGNAYTPEDSMDANKHLCVHPNLWENGASNHLSGVFEVLPGKIYQVRGYDMSNLTFVRSNPSGGDPRWIVFDTLMSNECTKVAMDLFEAYLKKTYSDYSLSGSIVGMIISHSHIDHYGGMETVMDYFIDPKNPDNNGKIIENSDDEDDGKNTENAKESKDDVKKVANCFILAPAGFYDHAVSENVYLGNAMGRRASYQYGSFIKPMDENDLCGEISIGIGQGQSTGKPSAVGRPTIEILENVTLQLDEIKVEFQLTPGTEAPAEMNNYIQDYQALWLAENCSGTLHNLYTLRGAEIRDAKAWSHFLMEAAVKYGNKTNVIFQSHNWPHWKNGTTENDVPTVNIRDFIIETASIYKYIHDQALLYMNMGYKMNEVADMLVLPRGMQKNWTLKPFYGTPVHNAKAVYQKYLGWYDANPIHLQELPPEQLAKETLRYVMAGSREKMLSMIDEDIAKGNYWTAAYMSNQMILSGDCDDISDKVRNLCATALRQLGAQCESGTWRNAYLSAAYELVNKKLQPDQVKSDQLAQMPPETLLDYISIFFDGELAAKFNCDSTLAVLKNGIYTYFAFVVKNGAILYYEITEEEYNKSDNKINVSFDELKSVAIGKYSVENNILRDISNALINVASYKRFKYFDIIGRHDSEVKASGDNPIDLKKEVSDCILLLEKYVGKFNKKTPVLVLSEEDKQSWNDYYKLLKEDTHVILDGDFFIPGDKSMGIGNDGKFMQYELFYTLYALYRYLYRSYLKNDYGYKGNNFDEESFAKLKQSIVLLETYVADYYLCNSKTNISLEDDDFEAWRYLNNDTKESSKQSLNVADFFKELYKRYKELSCEIKSTGKNFFLESVADDKRSITVHNASHNRLQCNNVELNDVIQNDSAVIDVSKIDKNAIVETFYQSGEEMFVTGRLVYRK